MIAWSEVTKFGDVTITTFAALAIAGWLLVENERRLALCWGLLFGLGLCVVIVTKMAFIGWGIGIRSLDFAGFSGHAMRAAAVLPVLLYLVLQRTPSFVRSSGILLGLALAMVIGVSRLAVHAHSVSEITAGWMLGSCVSLGFIRIAGKSLRKPVLNPWRIVLSLITLLPAPYVHPAPTQQWLTNITLYFSGHDQPFPREGWRTDRVSGRPPGAL